MIPTIETIVEDLIAGKITKSQAVTWLLQHAEDARRDLRDYFAAKALAGICGDGIPGSHHMPEVTARAAYDYADAMLAKRTGARRP